MIESISREDLIALLYQALAAPIGLVLATSDREQARQRLYAARATAGDPALAELQIRISPLGEGDLVLLKRRVRVTGAS